MADHIVTPGNRISPDTDVTGVEHVPPGTSAEPGEARPGILIVGNRVDTGHELETGREPETE